jgi:hypothetical protein
MNRAPRKAPGPEEQDHSRQNKPIFGSEQAAPELSPAALSSLDVAAFAAEHGWDVELTSAGRTCCGKNGSVLFAPGHGASVAAYREMLERLGAVDRYMTRWRRP